MTTHIQDSKNERRKKKENKTCTFVGYPTHAALILENSMAKSTEKNIEQELKNVNMVLPALAHTILQNVGLFMNIIKIKIMNFCMNQIWNVKIMKLVLRDSITQRCANFKN